MNALDTRTARAAAALGWPHPDSLVYLAEQDIEHGEDEALAARAQARQTQADEDRRRAQARRAKEAALLVESAEWEDNTGPSRA